MTNKTEIDEIWLGDLWEHDSFTTEWAKVKKRPEPGYSKRYIRSDLAIIKDELLEALGELLDYEHPNFEKHYAAIAKARAAQEDKTNDQ